MIILLLFQFVMIPKCAARSHFKFTITEPELALSTAWQFYNLCSLKRLPYFVIISLRIVLHSPTSPSKDIFIWCPCLVLHWEVEAIRQAVYHSPSHQPASIGTCTLPSLCSDEVPLNHQCLHLTFLHEACIHQPGCSHWGLQLCPSCQISGPN